MNDGLRPYPDCIESGLAWLGAIPAHWKVLRCKYLFREIDERSTTGEETHLSMSQKHGLIPSSGLEGKSLQSASYVGGKLCQPNDLVLNRLKAHLGVFARAKQSGVISPDYTVLRPTHGDDVTYYENVFKTPACIAELRRSTKGIVEGFWRLYTDDFYNIRVPVPPPDERLAILRFIAAEDARVRKFIRNRRRLIEVLNEQKQAIINDPVTRGLDADVRLKSSGVAYLGDVPEHWEVRRLKTIAAVRLSSVNKVIVEGETPVRLCNYVDVYRNDVITNDIDFMLGSATASEIEVFSLQEGDVLITKDSEDWQDIAVPAFVPKSLNGVVCGYHLAVVRPHRQCVRGEYLSRAFSASTVGTQFRINANGVTRYGLSQGAIKGAFFPMPPIEEQDEIIAYVATQCREIFVAIATAEKEIDLIREYRTRLVADVVTGKLDVRHLAPAPEEIESGDLEPIEGEEDFDDELSDREDAEFEEVAHADD